MALAGVVAFYGASLAVQRAPVAAALQRRLAASFGRAVEVRRFDVSLWGGPQLEAQGVSVAEDPRFGHEYFLRAERLTAGIRWSALVAGRLEFDSIVLTRPSLNLVRTPDGQWNLESWLPWPSAMPSVMEPGPPAPPEGRRLQSVRIEGGRINFKRGVDKHPFAVVGVEGAVSQAGSGQWSIDVEGRPMRAGVVVQETGTIRVRGTLGGTSARFRPANLAVRWEQASLSDALRLLTGFDHGVRGELNVEGRVSAPAPDATASDPAGSPWGLAGTVRVRGVHRWDLPLRDNDPALNAGLEAKWWPALALAEFTRIALEGPASLVRGSGFVQWGHPPAGYRGSEPKVSAAPDASLRFVSSGISLNDLFRWYPAFHAEMANNLSVKGNAGLDLEVRGWPLRVERAVMASDGGRLGGPGSGDALALSSTVLRYERQRGRVELGPATILLGPAGATPATALRIEAAAVPGSPWRLQGNVAVDAANARTLFQLAAALGIAPLHGWAQAGWDVEGLAELRLRWQGTLFPFAVQPRGTVRLRNARLSSPALSEPVTIAGASMEFAPTEKRITVQNVRALGTAWSGSFVQRSGEPWEVALSADTLDVVAARRWLVPEAPSVGFLQRLAPGGSAPRRLTETFAGLRTRGHVSIGQLRFFSLALSQFKSSFAVDFSGPARLELSDASATLFGGSIAGKLEARAPVNVESAAPSYRMEAQIRGVNLAALTAGAPRLRGNFSGVADGTLTLAANGADRAALLNSLAGEGTLAIRNGQASLLDLGASIRMERTQRGTTLFSRATGGFTLAERKLAFAGLQLFGPSARLSSADWLVVGTADLSGSAIVLDLSLALPGEQRLPVRAGQAVAAPGRTPARREFRLRGPLNAVELAPRP